MHWVHVNYFVHGAGQNYVGLLLPVLQVLLRATCGAQSHEQPRQEQRCPAGPDCPRGSHDHRWDVAPRSKLSYCSIKNKQTNKLPSAVELFCTEPPFPQLPLRTTSVSFTPQPCFPHLQPGLKIPLCRRRLGDQEGRVEGGGGRRRKGQGALSPGM